MGREIFKTFAGFTGYGSYAPTKWAVRGLADCLRNEVSPSPSKLMEVIVTAIAMQHALIIPYEVLCSSDRPQVMLY